MATSLASTTGDAAHIQPRRSTPVATAFELLAAIKGQSHLVHERQPLSDVVDQFDAHPQVIGVLVVNDDGFTSALFRDGVARLLARPYTQALFLHRPVGQVIPSSGGAPLECSDTDAITDVIGLALARSVAERYDPIVVRSADGSRRLVDAHDLLMQQNRVLADTLASLERQRAVTARVEREREDLHAQLLDASRNAGRAEVATGILHNVGNVLNSVSVSRAVIARRIEQSKVGNLGKAVELISTHRGDLAGFLTLDRRGQEIPGYLAKLAHVLASEQEEIAREIRHLGDNIEHIKQVVATQQSYARSGAVLQLVRPSDLMEDALRMHVLSLDRHNICVERHYVPNDPVPLDRHRILQILINLISNAKNAVKQVPGEHRIVLGVGPWDRPDAEGLKFVVQDNGIGIRADHLTKIFGHGFTTRRSGHGFGLHSSANVARELAGTLVVESEGEGQGARFTLELPVLRATGESA